LREYLGANLADNEGREYFLKLFQAWLDTKFKLASYALIGNAGALTVTLAFIKDKGPDFISNPMFPLGASAVGIGTAVVGLIALGIGAEITFITQAQLFLMSERDLTKVIDPERLTMRVSHTLFDALLFISGICFVVSVGFASAGVH
jgi:hypothetical protein